MVLDRGELKELLIKFIKIYKESEEYSRKLLLNMNLSTYIEIPYTEFKESGILGFDYTQRTGLEKSLYKHHYDKEYCKLHVNTDFFRTKNKNSIIYDYDIARKLCSDNKFIVSIVLDDLGTFWRHDLEINNKISFYHFLMNENIILNCDLTNICIYEECDDILYVGGLHQLPLDRINSSTNIIKNISGVQNLKVNFFTYMYQNKINIKFDLYNIDLMLYLGSEGAEDLKIMSDMIQNKNISFNINKLNIYLKFPDYNRLDDILNLISLFIKCDIAHIYDNVNPLKVDIYIANTNDNKHGLFMYAKLLDLLINKLKYKKYVDISEMESKLCEIKNDIYTKMY